MPATLDMFTASGLSTDIVRGEIFVLFHESIPSAAGYKDVSLKPKMCRVAKVGAIEDNFASYKNLDPDLARRGRNYTHGNLMSVSSTRTRYPSLLSFDVSKCDTGTRNFANLTSSALSIPWRSARTPLRSITAIVLSLDKRISSVSVASSQIRKDGSCHVLDPKSPSEISVIIKLYGSAMPTHLGRLSALL